MRIGTTVALAALLAAACDLPLEDGHYGCAESGECPGGMHCWSDGLCRSMAETDGGSPDGGSPDSSMPGCGDGNLDVGEGCDDGNTNAGDGCTGCEADDGFTCTGTPSMCSTTCGDGTAAGAEACDDGNTLDETECDYGTPACTSCNATCDTELPLNGPFCGDTSVHLAAESCDDGNTVDETECDYGTPTCTTCNLDCTAELSRVGRICGDGVVDPEEECDYDDVGCTSCAFDTLLRASLPPSAWNGNSYASADARWIAWRSRGVPLVSADMDTLSDVYMRDLASNGPPILVSRSTDGRSSANADAFPFGMSDDGDVVVFHSTATNLHADDTDSNIDVFVFTLSTMTMEAITSGGTTGTGGAQDPSISGDGRFVSFWTAEAAISGDPGHRQTVLYDRVMGTYETVSVNSAGIVADHTCEYSSINFDGRFVAFQSESSTLDGPEECCRNDWDIFVRDRIAGTTTRVSVATDGSEGDGDSVRPKISPDGRYVAFSSEATNLGSGDDTNGVRDIFLHDRVTGVTSRVTLHESGSEPTVGAPPWVGNVTNAGVVAFQTSDSLVWADTDARDDVYLWDVATGGLRLVSTTADDMSVDVRSDSGRITPDGSVVVFVGWGRGLTGDSGTHVYRRIL